MKHLIIWLLCAAFVFSSCNGKRDFFGSANDAVSAQQSSNATATHYAEVTSLENKIDSKTGLPQGSEAWIAALPDSVEITFVVGDSWGNKMAYSWGYTNVLLKNNIVIRAVGGTTWYDWIDLIKLFVKHKKRIKTFIVHLGTNDIGLSHPMASIVSNAKTVLDYIYANYPNVKVYLNTVEPHMRHIVRGWKPRIDSLNTYYYNFITEYTAQRKNIDLLDTYTAFSIGSPLRYTNMALYGPDSLHYNIDGEVVIRDMWVKFANLSDGRAVRDTDPVYDTSAIPPSYNPVPGNQVPVVGTYASAYTVPRSWLWFPAINSNSSKDPDGYIVKYEWSQISGPAATTTVVSNGMSTVNKNYTWTDAAGKTYTGYKPGVYRFLAKVTDNKGAYAFKDISIVVTDN